MADIAFAIGRPHGSGEQEKVPNDRDRSRHRRIYPSACQGERMIQIHTIDSLAQRLAALVPPGLQDARADLTATFRSALQAGLRELDLVSREEFDVQRCVLLRTREKIEELEQQLLALEREIGVDSTPRH